MFKVIKHTGEVKDTFKFVYNEKGRAWLKIIELVKRLSGRRYPAFTGNSESLSVVNNVRLTSPRYKNRRTFKVPRPAPFQGENWISFHIHLSTLLIRKAELPRLWIQKFGGIIQNPVSVIYEL